MFLAIIQSFDIVQVKGLNKQKLGRTIDFYRANGGQINVGVNNVITASKLRWSTNQDVARLFQLMLGTKQAQGEFIKSLKFMTRARLDDTVKKSLKTEYWIDLSKKYNDTDSQIHIDCGDDMVNLYLRANMTCEYRTS